MYKSNKEGYVEEINTLVNALDISAADAIEIINVFFECFADGWLYEDFLYRNIRIIRDTEENQPLIAELETIDDICMFEGDDYYMITNYNEALEDGLMGDVLKNPF